MNRQKLIFMVDDDPFINMLVVKKFTTAGYQVEAYESGEECLKGLHKDPDVIILDYFFTKADQVFMNGLEVFNKIKELKPRIPVIMLSGQDKGEIVLELARKGIDDYVIKDNNLLDNLEVSVREILQANK